MKLTLYGTQDCHLCELASELIAQTAPDLIYDFVDIALDTNSKVLIERYATQIPVLKANKELFWPFNRSDLEQFLRTELVDF